MNDEIVDGVVIVNVGDNVVGWVTTLSYYYPYHDLLRERLSYHQFVR
jgi:hypothetical protein